MFNPKNKQKRSPARLTLSSLSSKPLLYVLDYEESSDDFDDLPHKLWQKALKGESDVFISRAEIDLRKAMQAFSLSNNSSINSIQSLTALSLPDTAIALFWAIYALLQQKYQKPDLTDVIHRRNHDARLLFQRLAQLNLDPWYTHSVHRLPFDEFPAGTQFPLGHPIPGQIYRHHPFKTRKNFYYPINSYFSLLFEERKQALLNLLETLGATKVVFTPISQEDSSCLDFKRQTVVEFAPQSQRSRQIIEAQDHPWLIWEPAWQSIVDKRLKIASSSMQFQFDIDVMDLLKTPIQAIEQLVLELRSMALPNNYEEILSAELLYPQHVDVDFS